MRRRNGAQHFFRHAPAVDQSRDATDRRDRQHADDPFDPVAHHDSDFGSAFNAKPVPQRIRQRRRLSKALGISQAHPVLHHQGPVAVLHGLMVKPRQSARCAFENLAEMARDGDGFKRMRTTRANIRWAIGSIAVNRPGMFCTKILLTAP